MYKSILIILTLLSSALVAQVKIKGKVTNKENIPIESLEIILISKDSSVIKFEFTNEEGNFQLESQKGSYILQIRQFNYLFFFKKIELDTNIDFGNITIDNAHELNSIEIEFKNKLIEKKIDRLVFNVENSINSSGGNALEMLNITPGVRVQNDKISMIGKSSLSVMVDDKIVQLSDEELANYIKSIPSDDIKSIEVITTPPSKYEASGNSGLVNIKLKKTRKNSWNALAGSTYIQRKYGEGSCNGNFNYNKNKLGVSSSFYYKNGSKYADQDDYAYFPNGLWYTSSPYKIKYASINGKLGMDYQVSSKWIMGSQFLINTSKSVYTDSPYTSVYDNATGQTSRYLKSDGKTVQNPNIKSLNFYNEFKIDSIGRKIYLNLDYFKFNNDDTKTYGGISVIAPPLIYSKKYFAGVNINKQDITNLSAKLDIDCPIKWATLSFGGKISNSKAKNGISSFNSGIVDYPVFGLPLTQNKFEYIENVEALYVSGNKKINNYWESQLGLRMEATQTKTSSSNLIQSITNNYLKFFPTVHLSYTPNDSSTFTLSYSKRINRPSFYDLNPNVYFVNPFQTIEGNPFLQPAFIDNIELNYGYKKLDSKLYFSNENNVFAQIPIADLNTNFIRFTNENYINTQRYGISENFVFDKYKWWTSNNAVDLNYAISKSSIAITQREQKGVNSRISTSNDFSLNSNKTLFVNLSYWYSFPGIDGIYHIKSMNSLSIAIQYLLLNKNLKISLEGNDLFRTEKVDMNSTVNGIYQEGKYYYDTQSFHLSISYKLGNKKIQVEERETGNEDEKSRTGN